MKGFLFLLLMAGPASAGCSEELRFALDRLGIAAAKVEGEVAEAGGRCEFRNVRLQQDRLLSTVDRVVWIASGLGDEPPFVGPESGSLSLDLEIAGYRFQPLIGDAWWDYLYGLQARRQNVDARLSVEWDLPEGRLTVAEISLDFPGENLVAASWTVDGLGLPALSGQQSELSAIRLVELMANISNSGYLDSLVFAPLGALLNDGSDPAERMAELKQMATGFVAILPTSFLPEDSQRALLALIQDAPFPWGDLSLDLNGDIAASDLLELGLAGDPLAAFARAFRNARLDIDYRPAPE